MSHVEHTLVNDLKPASWPLSILVAKSKTMLFLGVSAFILSVRFDFATRITFVYKPNYFWQRARFAQNVRWSCTKLWLFRETDTVGKLFHRARRKLALFQDKHARHLPMRVSQQCILKMPEKEYKNPPLPHTRSGRGLCTRSS